jgi:hypothetical protein
LYVIATHKNIVMQVWDLSASSAFSDLGGSPPQAGHIAIINRFLVASDLASNPFRVHWSGLNATTTWTSGVNNSDFQDLPSGGRVRCVADVGYDVGIILQDTQTRRMIFQPGSAAVFQIDRLKDDVGILAPYSMVTAGGYAFFLSQKGFCQMSPDGGLAMIGEERVDRTILGSDAAAPSDIQALAFEASNINMMIGSGDPKNNRIVWAYQSRTGTPGLIDRGMVYHWTLKRWAPIEIAAEFIAQLSRPGATLEGLDSIGAQAVSNAVNNGSGLVRLTVGSTAGWTTGDYKTVSGVTGATGANGTFAITVINGTTIDLQGSTFGGAYISGGIVGGSIDAITTSLDDFSVSSLPALSAFETDHKLSLLSATNTEAVLETAEQRLEGPRVNINGVWPHTDAATVYASTVRRDALKDGDTDGAESLAQEDGFCPLLDQGRNVRSRIRIPAGTAWSYARGVEMDVGPAGRF